MTQTIPSPIRPAELDDNSTSSQARKFGAAKPPRLPIELISAMPPAAAAPRNRLVGIVQNKAGDTIRPAAATLSAISATSGDGVIADIARPAPDVARASAPIPRELPCRSHQGGMMVTATSAQAQGMAETRPTSSPMLVPK